MRARLAAVLVLDLPELFVRLGVELWVEAADAAEIL